MGSLAASAVVLDAEPTAAEENTYYAAIGEILYVQIAVAAIGAGELSVALETIKRDGTDVLR